MSIDLKEKAEKVKDATREQMLGFVTAALSLVAGLAWNDAITSAIKEVFPVGASNIWAKFVYAVLVTVVVVALTLIVRKILSIQAPEKK
jgi:uncharacterized BrkB/YihY/UPF0761 family membrane protein